MIEAIQYFLGTVLQICLHPLGKDKLSRISSGLMKKKTMKKSWRKKIETEMKLKLKESRTERQKKKLKKRKKIQKNKTKSILK
jgi:hypothetical protein